MKKFSSEQNGIAPIATAIIIALLIIVGAVGYIFFARDDPGSEPAGSTAETSEETETADIGSFTGSYFDALEQGRALQCQWRLPEDIGGEFQVGEGQFYTDGQNRGYSEASFQFEGESSTAYAVFDSEFVYTWFNIPGVGLTGTKVPMSQMEDEFSELPAEQQQQAIDVRADYAFECSPWNVDENLFTPPSDITFTEITAP